MDVGDTYAFIPSNARLEPRFQVDRERFRQMFQSTMVDVL
jgi:hypothetical protein